MFGYGKPRFHVSGNAIPELNNNNFDVVKLIRDTIKELSYSHPILNRRLNKTPTPQPEDEEPEVSDDVLALTDDEFENDKTVAASIETLDLEASLPKSIEHLAPIKVQKEPLKKALVLPSIYNHQGYRPLRKDFSKRGSTPESRLDIHEAGKYHYIRAMPHQSVKRTTSNLQLHRFSSTMSSNTPHF